MVNVEVFGVILQGDRLKIVNYQGLVKYFDVIPGLDDVCAGLEFWGLFLNPDKLTPAPEINDILLLCRYWQQSGNVFACLIWLRRYLSFNKFNVRRVIFDWMESMFQI